MTRHSLKGLLAVALAVLVIGCAVREPRPAGSWMEERASWFAAHPAWSVSGRVALRDGERGGSLSFEWQASGELHRIHLRTVTGGRQWILLFGPGYAELEGSEVGRIVGPDPDELVEEAVGWPIPVRALSDWIRGLARPGEARVEFAADGTIRRVEQHSWELVYQRFSEIDGQLMPTRLEAESPPYRVRMVMRSWQWRSDLSGSVASDRAMPL